MYVSTYIGGNYVRDGVLSITNKSKNKQLICKSGYWLDLLQMEQKIIHMTESIIHQIAEDKNGQPQPGLINEGEELTAKYLKLRSYIIPKIGEVVQDEEISNILKEKDDQDLTMFKIIRAMSNYLNNKMKNNRDLSKVLGKGYKENEEEDNQVMQRLFGGKGYREKEKEDNQEEEDN